MFDSLTFVTGNKSKAEQLARHLEFQVSQQKLDLAEIQSLDLEEIVRRKAEEAYRIVQSPVLVEDTSLTFHALGKLPGPLIKWFLTELDNDGLCALLKGKERNATAKVMFALFDEKECHIFSAEKQGTIAETPKGDRGFGWDPIFIPNDYSKTWGEMDDNEQKETSMRRIALKELESFLKADSSNIFHNGLSAK